MYVSPTVKERIIQFLKTDKPDKKQIHKLIRSMNSLIKSIYIQKDGTIYVKCDPSILSPAYDVEKKLKYFLGDRISRIYRDKSNDKFIRDTYWLYDSNGRQIRFDEQ